MISMCSGCGSLGSERPNASANWGPSTDHGTRSGGRKVWSRRQSRSIVGVVIRLIHEEPGQGPEQPAQIADFNDGNSQIRLAARALADQIEHTRSFGLQP